MTYAEATIWTPTDVVTISWAFGCSMQAFGRLEQYHNDGVLSEAETWTLFRRMVKANHDLSMNKLLDDVLSIRTLA